MRSYLLIALWIFFQSCQGQQVEWKSSLMHRLKQADIEENHLAIKQLFSDDAIIIYPDSPPFMGIGAILEVYDIIWKRNQAKTIEYRIDTAFYDNLNRFEQGKYFFKENDVLDSISFKTEIIIVEGNSKIKSLTYGNKTIEDIRMRLPKPTGQYIVGRSAHYYNNNKRPLAFEIWYPAEQASGDVLSKQSIEVTKAIAEFQGWPMAHCSHFSSILSNAYSKAIPVADTEFPVLLYNHGYSGYTSVYQTVFEELASHGYIVVSVGHKHESALFIKGNGEVIRSNPNNKFFTSRASELNGNKINQFQSVILNSDDENAVCKAYQQYIKLSPLHTQSVELWAEDTKMVLEKLKQFNKHGSYKGIFDFNRIGVFGHSVGGAVAGELAWNCPEVKAGINLDGFQFGNLINHSIGVPFLFVSSNHQGNSYLRISPFAMNARSDVYHAVLKSFSHDNFTDMVFAVDNNIRYVEIQRELILNYFNMVLKKGNESQFENRLSQYNEIILNKYY